MLTSTTNPPSQQSRRRRKITNSTLQIPDLFLHTCNFVSSISDLLNFREAMGESGLVLPDPKGPSGQTDSSIEGDSLQELTKNRKIPLHSTDSTKKSASEMDKVCRFQEVAKNLVLSQWPSLKPLQASMENKSRWLNIGRVLELRDETKTPEKWQTHVKHVRGSLSKEKNSLETEFCREHFDMLCDTVTFVNVERRGHPSVFGYKTYMTAKFVHPMHGNWISYEVVRFLADIQINEFWFEFPIRPDSKQTIQCEFESGETSLDNETIRRMWEFMTKANPPEFPPHKNKGMTGQKTMWKKCWEMGNFLKPLESAFPDIMDFW